MCGDVFHPEPGAARTDCPFLVPTAAVAGEDAGEHSSESPEAAGPAPQGGWASPLPHRGVAQHEELVFCSPPHPLSTQSLLQKEPPQAGKRSLLWWLVPCCPSLGL